MNDKTHLLRKSGVSLWIDNITRGMLKDGTLKRYIDEFNVTGLTSNPTIFDNAISKTDFYDKAIQDKVDAGLKGEDLFFELAIEDLRKAADLFKPVHEHTNGLDGYVSLEVSPLLAYDADKTIEEARKLHERTDRPNLFIKIPGTPEGLPAIEKAVFEGIPVNVTLLFSSEQYLAAADAYLRGIEKRIEAGKDPDVRSVASIFISRWDKATMNDAPSGLKNKLGIAVAKRTYKAYRKFLMSDRVMCAMNHGVRPQRLLWASTGTKDPEAPDTLYVHGLVAPYTVNTMPDKTLQAFADHGSVDGLLPPDGGEANEVIKRFEKAGIGYEELAERLQKEGADSFTKSWKGLLETIEDKSKITNS